MDQTQKQIDKKKKDDEKALLKAAKGAVKAGDKVVAAIVAFRATEVTSKKFAKAFEKLKEATDGLQVANDAVSSQSIAGAE